MSKIRTNSVYYDNIADAIRYKNGEQTIYYPADMAQAILDIPTGGGGEVNLKDIFNHGLVTGLNPLYGSYDATNHSYHGILNSSDNSTANDAVWFTIENNGEYIKRVPRFFNQNLYEHAYCVFALPISSANYRKVKVDCEILNGRENSYNISEIGLIDFRELYADYYDVTSSQSYLYHITNSLYYRTHFIGDEILTQGSQGIYNKSREVVTINITEPYDSWYCIGLRTQACEMRVYSMWLEE